MIKFTDRAKDKILQFMKDSQRAGMALRIVVKSRSAKGFEYDFQLEDYGSERPSDQTVREGGFATRLDSESAKFLKGATVDWVHFDGGAGFSVQNPNSPIPDDRPESLKEGIVDAIKTIFDPEIPQVNIYELGLIYDVVLDDEKNATVTMTLTAPNCPAAEMLPAETERKAASVPGVKTAKVVLTFEPAWTPERMSEAARLTLNLM